jgi:hypothetical protein
LEKIKNKDFKQLLRIGAETKRRKIIRKILWNKWTQIQETVYRETEKNEGSLR